MDTTIRTDKPGRKAGSATEASEQEMPADARAERKRWTLALLVVAAAGAVRLGLAAVVPLVPDEAYYWEWSRQLAPGYFDHPPVIAVLIAGGTLLFGETSFGVRFLPVLCGVLAMLLVVDVAGRHGGGTAALRGAMISAAVPIGAVGLVLATPDAPLLLAYAASIAALDRAIAAQPRSGRSYGWWLAAGLAVGVGLSAKYSAAILPFSVLIACLVSGRLRSRLSTPEPYLSAGVALLIFSPVIVWNSLNNWASFAFQFRHGFGSAGGSAVAREVELITGQLGLVSPILFVLIVLAVAGSASRRADSRELMLAVISIVTFAVFIYSALSQRVQPNWPAPAYVPAFVLLATFAGARQWRRWLWGGVLLGLGLTTVIYVHTLRPILPLSAGDDPVAQAFGWDVLADAVGTALPPVEGRFWVAANRYQDAAQLAFNLPGRPQVLSLNIDGRANQYDFWPGFPDLAVHGDGLILVLEPGDADYVIDRLTPLFEAVRRHPQAELRRDGTLIGTRSIWYFSGWRGDWTK